MEKKLIIIKVWGPCLDDDYSDGVARSIAHRLNLETGKKVYTLGLDDRTAGFSKSTDNLPPSENKIKDFIKKIINNAKK